MKKRWVVYILAVFVVCVAVWGAVQLSDRKDVPDFEIVYSMKNGADNFQSVDISAVVNVKEYDKEAMLSRVRDYYCEMNGEVDELDIRLYDSRKNFEDNIVSAESNYQIEK